MVNTWCLGRQGWWTLGVWGIEDGGIQVFGELRKVDSRWLGHRGRWTLVVRGTNEYELFGYETFAPNEDSIPEEISKGSHSNPRFLFRRRWTLGVWGIKNGGLQVFGALRKVDSKVWGTEKCELFGYETLAPNDDGIPKELPRGHTQPLGFSFEE